MGLSTTLLIVATATGLITVGSNRFRVPTSVREAFVAVSVGGFVALAGLVATAAVTDRGQFAVAHLLWLLAVITVPLVSFAWALAARLDGAMSRRAAAFAASGLLIAAGGVYGTHIEPNRLRVDTHVLATPSTTAKLRIGVLADVQTPNIGDHEQHAVETLLERSPDLIVVPGDLYQGNAETIIANTNDFVVLLGRLVDQVELVVVVSGDSDDRSILEPITVAAGATYLDNRSLDVTVGGVETRLVGVAVHDRGPDRGSTLADLTVPTDRLTVLVSHRPDVVYELAPTADVDIIVSGHTHGGQVAVPFFGPLITHSEVPRSVAAGGLSQIGGVPLYVSTGVGLERRSAPQVRFGVRPSVGIIDLVPVVKVDFVTPSA